jgi:tRNA threonylcarbamoyladenosine biosynthesis protein TsaB
MRILSLDASTDICSVALGGEEGFVERSAVAGQRHSELLLPMIQALLAGAETAVGDLDGIAFGSGPGSFTGLRIACGVAQGLALGVGLPVIGIPTLEAMAEVARLRGGGDRVLAALDARMHEVYIAAFEYEGASWRARVAPAVIAAELAPLPPGSNWFGAGGGFEAYPALRARLDSVLIGFDAAIAPAASAIGALALPGFAAGKGVDARCAAPLYVRHRVALTTAERAAGTLR